MLIDFDHGVVEVERPIRMQGIYKRDVRVGHNCWIGYGACILRGVSVGDNCVMGTNTVVTRDLPDERGRRRRARRACCARATRPERLRWATARPARGASKRATSRASAASARAVRSGSGAKGSTATARRPRCRRADQVPTTRPPRGGDRAHDAAARVDAGGVLAAARRSRGRASRA